jgi:hypothetical protein
MTVLVWLKAVGSFCVLWTWSRCSWDLFGHIGQVGVVALDVSNMGYYHSLDCCHHSLVVVVIVDIAADGIVILYGQHDLEEGRASSSYSWVHYDQVAVVHNCLGLCLGIGCCGLVEDTDCSFNCLSCVVVRLFVCCKPCRGPSRTDVACSLESQPLFWTHLQTCLAMQSAQHEGRGNPSQQD